MWVGGCLFYFSFSLACANPFLSRLFSLLLTRVNLSLKSFFSVLHFSRLAGAQYFIQRRLREYHRPGLIGAQGHDWSYENEKYAGSAPGDCRPFVRRRRGSSTYGHLLTKTNLTIQVLCNINMPRGTRTLVLVSSRRQRRGFLLRRRRV